MDIRKKEKQMKISIEDIPTSHISYADFTSALIDILENGSYVRQRMTIVGESGCVIGSGPWVRA